MLRRRFQAGEPPIARPAANAGTPGCDHDLFALEPRLLLAGQLTESVTIKAGTYHPGDAVAITTKLNNTGDAATVAGTFSVFASRNAVLGDGDDVLLLTAPFASVPASGSTSVNATVSLPPLGTGSYFVLGNASVAGLSATFASATASLVVGTPGLSVVASDAKASESGNPATDPGAFTIAIDTPALTDTTIQYNLTGTATNGLDFTALPGSVVIPAGQKSVTINVLPVDDIDKENSETVILTLVAPPHIAINAGKGSATVTIADNEPTISIAATKANASETNPATTGKGTFTITRTGATTAAQVVGFELQGTATPTTDFTLSTTAAGGITPDNGSFLVTIPAGKASITIDAVPVADAVADSGETVIMHLLAQTGTNGAGDTVPIYGVAAQASATVTISDSAPIVSIKKTKDASETNPATSGKGKFTLTRTGDLSQPLTVDFAVAGTATDPGDYSLATTAAGGLVAGMGFTSITFPAHQSTVTLDLTPVDDNTAEGPETVILTLQQDAGQTYNVATGAAATASVTIADNEPVVSIAVTKATASETNPSTSGKGIFTVTRMNGSTAAPLTVNYTVAGTATPGDDYAALLGSVVIPAGKTSAQIVLTPVDDAIGDAGETVIVTLAADAAYSIDSTKPAGTITIADNEPVVSIAATKAAASETNGATTGKGTFTISRTGGPTNVPLTVHYAVTGTATPTADYPALSGTAILPAGKTSVTINIAPVDDGVAEPNETVILTLLADAAYSLDAAPAKQAATVTIADTQPTVSIVATKAAVSETDPTNTGKGTLTITRTGATTAPLTVALDVTGTATATTDYTALPPSVVIPAGKASVTLDLVPVDDGVAEPTETVIVALAADPAYHITATAAQASATLTIADNSPIVTIIAARNASTTNFATTGKGIFAVMRSGGDLTQPLTVFFTPDAASTATEFNPLGQMITIPAGQTSALLIVEPTGNALANDHETIILNLDSNSTYNLGSALSSATMFLNIA